MTKGPSVPNIGSLTVRLPMAGGSLTLSGCFNALDLYGRERELVFALLDLMQGFKPELPSEESEVDASIDAQTDTLNAEMKDFVRKLEKAGPT